MSKTPHYEKQRSYAEDHREPTSLRHAREYIEEHDRVRANKKEITIITGLTEIWKQRQSHDEKKPAKRRERLQV